MMKRLVLLNAPVLTTYGKFEFKKISIDRAKEIVRQADNLVSAIGHAATAEIMSELLDFKVETNRIEFFQTTEDTVLIFRLNKRIGEGQVLNRDEIEAVGYELGILTKF